MSSNLIIRNKQCRTKYFDINDPPLQQAVDMFISELQDTGSILDRSVHFSLENVQIMCDTLNSSPLFNSFYRVSYAVMMWPGMPNKFSLTFTKL